MVKFFEVILNFIFNVIYCMCIFTAGLVFLLWLTGIFLFIIIHFNLAPGWF